MSNTAIFRKAVADFMQAAPTVVDAQVRAEDAVGRMALAGASALVVVAGNGRIAGIVTEQDVVRRLAFRDGGEAPISSVMTGPVVTVAADDYLYHAIARMRRLALRHMPVVDERGMPVGMLNLDAALAAATDQQMAQIDRLTQEGTLDGLREVKAAEVDLARELTEDNVPAPEVQSVLTHINRDIHRRVIEANLRAMHDEGLGPPPVDFCFIVMGSAGRGESYVYPDQDNGMVLDDYEDEDHARVDAWFVDLAGRITRDLDGVGFPLCDGHVMATNPVWRKTLSQWRTQLKGWCAKRNVVALRLADIFFDFRSVYGASDLAADLRTYVTGLIAANAGFLRELQHDDDDQGVGIGWFGRFITEKEDPRHLGKLNLKSSGTLPLVQAVRLLALGEGIGETSTLARLRLLRARDVIDADDFDYLAGAFGHITRLMLRQQISDFEAGVAPSNYVHPETLSTRERDMLIDSLKAVRRLRDQVRATFTGDIF